MEASKGGDSDGEGVNVRVGWLSARNLAKKNYLNSFVVCKQCYFLMFSLKGLVSEPGIPPNPLAQRSFDISSRFIKVRLRLMPV